MRHLISLSLILAFISLPVGAQTPLARKDASVGKRAAKDAKPRRGVARKATSREDEENPADVEYRFGEFTAPIDVTALKTTISVGLAQRAPIVVEFPGNDPIYATYPGDEDFVTIDDKESKADDVLVLRAGNGFSVQPGRAKLSSVISVQMTSGLIISLAIYPVSSVARNANRVVVTYDREKVIEARRRAGLRADLVPPAKLVEQLGYDPTGRISSPDSIAATPQTASPQSPTTETARRSSAPLSVLTSPAPTPAPPLMPANIARNLPATVAANYSVAPSAPVRTPTPAPRPTPVVASPSSVLNAAPSYDASTLDLGQVTRDEMNRVIKSAAQLKFGKPVYGLSLAVSRSRFVISGYRIEVVAVRNMLSEPLRLVPGQPEIYVERIGDGPIDSERLAIKTTVSTLEESAMLAPGSTYYFAFAFDEPILGARENLRIAVAQTNAADQPATANLITAAR